MDALKVNSESDINSGGISLVNLNKTTSYERMAQMDTEDNDSDEAKSPDTAVEAPLMDNQQTSSSPVDILNNIYDIIISEEEESEHKTKATETEGKHQTETEGEHQTETLCIDKKKPTETDKNENKNIIQSTVHRIEIMKKAHEGKSVLDTTMGHAERMDSIWAFINMRILLQVSVAILLALCTYYIEFGIWRVLHISHCTQDIVYLSWNSLKSCVYEMWQNGFCLVIGDVYLLTATVIDYDACNQLSLYHVPIRKIRFKIMCATMCVAFSTAFFIGDINRLMQIKKMPIFVVSCIVLYYIVLIKYRRYVTPQSWYILWPFAAYVGVITIIYCLGVGVAWLFRGSPIGFAAIYPMYIAFAQFIGVITMRNYHHFLCFLCKKKYLVSRDYNPNSYYSATEITSRYICTDSGGNILDYTDPESNVVDGRAVEYLWVDEWIYFICGMMIVFTESMRLSGLLAVKDDGLGIIISCLSALIMEVLQRNNLIWEFVYKCVLKKDNPNRCKFDALYYGAKYSWEYVPIGLLIQMNITRFGPSDRNSDCYKESLNGIYDLTNKYWWIIVVIILFEMATDILCEFMNWTLRRYSIIPINPKDDGARKIILIRLGLWGWTAVFITAIQVAQIGYALDHALYNMLNGDWAVVDDWWSFLTSFF